MDMKQKRTKKFEQIKPPKENVVLELSAEHDASAILGGAGDYSAMEEGDVPTLNYSRK
jgi:hypothetical protein